MADALTNEPWKLALRGVAVARGGRTILDVPRLDVRAGESLAIVGPNGAGKSTLLLQLALLDRPARGEVLFDGASTRRHELALRRRMAVVFQQPLLLDRSVSANVEAGLRMWQRRSAGNVHHDGWRASASAASSSAPHVRSPAARRSA